VGNQSAAARARLWHFGVALTVGLAAILFSLARAKRQVSQVQVLDDGPASRGPDSAVDSRPGQVSGVWRSSGLRRLAGWAAGRVGWILVVAALGVWSLSVGISGTNWVDPLSASANATVISSRDNGDPTDLQIWVDVWFRTSSRIVRTTIQPYPYGFHARARGQKVPIRYNPAAPSQAAYTGPSGDLQYTATNSPIPAYFGAAAWLSLAVVLLLTGASRLTGVMRAAPADVATPVRLRASGEIAHADQLPNSYSLEWRLLQYQPDVAGDVHILGEPAAGRWLVVRLDDGRFVWPASKAQPVLVSAALRLPVVQPGRVGSVHLLLAGYAHIVDLLSTLPVVVSRPPGSNTDWWWLGAPRPVVKTLVSVHMRRRLVTLDGALLRAALLCDDEPGSQSRRILAGASAECRAFTGTLPRRGLLAVLATIAATSLSIVSPFLLLPHIQLTGRVVSQYVPPVLAGMLIFGVAPLLMFFRSVRYKQALFNLPSGGSDRSVIKYSANVNADWNVYGLERAAFATVAVPEQREWESRQTFRWLIGTIYLVAIAIPIGYALPAPTLIILSVSAALFAVVRTYRWQRRVYTLQASQDQPKPVEDIPPGVAASMLRL
jgi:hypothetical protein